MMPAGMPLVQGCTIPIPLHFLPLHLCRIPAISALKHASYVSTCDFLGGVTTLRKGLRVCSNAICTSPLRADSFSPSRLGDLSRSVLAGGIIPLATKKVSCACPKGLGI